jgi:hypothetical protein
VIQDYINKTAMKALYLRPEGDSRVLDIKSRPAFSYRWDLTYEILKKKKIIL